MMQKKSMVFSLILLSTLGISSCGSTQSGGGGSAPRNPDHGPVVMADHLPSHLNWVRFGETTIEEARGHFTAENLYVTDNLDSTMGGTRDLVDSTRGPNEGIRFSTLGVTRSQANGGYVGDLGDDYGAVTFYFGRFPGNETPVLFRLEIAQRPDGTPNVCAPARALAEDPTALEGCSERVSGSPSVSDDAYRLCGGNHTGEHPMSIQCRPPYGTSGSSVQYVVIVPGVSPAAE